MNGSQLRQALKEYNDLFTGTASMWFDNPKDLAKFLLKSGYVNSDIVDRSNELIPSEDKVNIRDLIEVDVSLDTLKSYLSGFKNAYDLPKLSLLTIYQSLQTSLSGLEGKMELRKKKDARTASRLIKRQEQKPVNSTSMGSYKVPEYNYQQTRDYNSPIERKLPKR